MMRNLPGLIGGSRCTPDATDRVIARAAGGKIRDRAGCSKLNRLPAFVPTREFLPTIAS
jgi:hypothetical protein